MTNASFTLKLRHLNGMHSHISASKLNHLTVRELRAYGEKGCYVSSGSDIQAKSVFAGKQPSDDLAGWGYEPEPNWGTLRTAAGEERIAAEQGRYHDYYEAFAHAVRTKGPAPVTADEGIATLAVLDAAFMSAATGRTVEL